ncbi:hypothetical protein Hanom_Chr00s000001g01598541 [Helianthus anomalus]
MNKIGLKTLSNMLLGTRGVKLFDFELKWLKPLKHRDSKSNLLNYIIFILIFKFSTC